MARFRLRNPYNNQWLDACNTEMYARSSDNQKWIRLIPKQFAIRDGANSAWLETDCEYDPNFDDPCSQISIGGGSCSGGTSDALAGSGNGTGSDGPEFDINTGYPAGYDLPDAGISGFGLENHSTNSTPSGWRIRRPGIESIETESYDPIGVAAFAGLGNYENPTTLGISTFSRGMAITESIHTVGQEKGFRELLFATYSEGGISIDVYYLGVRVATTCGRVTGRGRLQFYVDPAVGENEERIMVRVRGEGSPRWTYQIIGTYAASPDDIDNLELNYFIGYEIGNYEQLLSPKYLGTPAFPAPCHATVFPMAERLVDRNYFEYYHYVGSEAGTMYLDYTSWETADFVEIYYAGKRIATTLDPAQGKGYLKFYYDPQDSQLYDIMVRIVSEDAYADDFALGSMMSWYYSLYCPDTKGSRQLPHNCNEGYVYSAGHPATEDNHFLADSGFPDNAVLIDVFGNTQNTLFTVYDEDGNILDSVQTNTRATLEFFLTDDETKQDILDRIPSHAVRKYITEKDKVYVRAEAGIGNDWSYIVRCPVPIMEIGNEEADYIQFECTELSSPDPSTPITEWDWVRKYINLDPSNKDSKRLDFGWKWGYEYVVYIVDRTGDNELATCHFICDPTIKDDAEQRWHANSDGVLPASSTSSSMWGFFFDPDDPDNESKHYFAKDYGDGKPWAVQVLERRIKVGEGSSGDNPDLNEWELVYDQLSADDNLIGRCRWEYGYEYIVHQRETNASDEYTIARIVMHPELENIPNNGRILSGGDEGALMFKHKAGDHNIDFYADGKLRCNMRDGSHSGEIMYAIHRRPIKMGDTAAYDTWQVLGSTYAGDISSFRWKENWEYFVYGLNQSEKYKAVTSGGSNSGTREEYKGTYAVGTAIFPETQALGTAEVDWDKTGFESSQSIRQNSYRFLLNDSDPSNETYHTVGNIDDGFDGPHLIIGRPMNIL